MIYVKTYENYISTCEGYEQWTEDRIRMEAANYADQYSLGTEGYANPDRLHWRYIKNYPIDNLEEKSIAEWIKWYKNEVALWAEEGDPDHYSDLESAG